MDSSMTDQDKITALRDALKRVTKYISMREELDLNAHDQIAGYNGKTPLLASDIKTLLDAMTAEASEPSGEQVGEAIGFRIVKCGTFIGAASWAATARNQALLDSGEVVRVYGAATKQANPRNFCPDCGKRTPPGSTHTCTPPADSEAALQALSDQSQEFTATRRAFDQSALDIFAESAK